MLDIDVEYITPSGKTMRRQKTVRSLAELEYTIRIMKKIGYKPVNIKVSQAASKNLTKP